MNPKQECIFCMCNQCYVSKGSSTKQEQRSTRGRRNHMKSIDDQNADPHSLSNKKCNAMDHHSHNLNQFVDSLYFSSTYKEKIKKNNGNHNKENKNVPFICTICKCDLVDK